MTRFKHNLILRIVKILDAVMVTVPFELCWYLYYAKRIASPFYAKGDYLVVALFFVLFIMFGRVYDAFLMSMQRISELIYGQFLAAAVSDFIMYIVIWLLSKHLPNILPGVAALASQLILASIWAYNAHHAYFKIFPPQATAVIYDTRQGMEKLIGKYGLDGKYKVVVTATAGEYIANLSMLDGVTTVFLSGIHSHDRNIILKHCVENNINVFVIPRIGDTIMSSAHHMHMFHLPMLRVGRYNPQPEYLFMKRLVDIVISAIALVILSPIFLVTAIAIKATDHGPVFYKQIRLTKDGKEFGILKFRSMRVDAEKDGVARLSSGENDDRITPVGKVIRACWIDELPQLLNILRGDLSIVGPRPERPEIAAQYCEEMPEFSLRLQAKAGLTGYAQVYGKYNTTPYDKLVMDLMYIAHPSIIEDFKIMFATVKILFMPESTEGISEGQTTAMDRENVEKTSVKTMNENVSTMKELFVEAIIVISLVAFVSGSAYGIFFAANAPGANTITVQQAVKNLTEEYRDRLEEISDTVQHDRQDITANDDMYFIRWQDILAVFSSYVSGDEFGSPGGGADRGTGGQAAGNHVGNECGGLLHPPGDYHYRNH